MKKFIVALTLLLASLTASAAEKEPEKYLHYKWSEATVISISNIPCPFKEHKAEYHHFSMVTNILDGTRVFGCFRPEINDMIKIQWYGGDFSAFPANAFLIHHLPKDLTDKLENKVVPKATL